MALKFNVRDDRVEKNGVVEVFQPDRDGAGDSFAITIKGNKVVLAGFSENGDIPGYAEVNVPASIMREFFLKGLLALG